MQKYSQVSIAGFLSESDFLDFLTSHGVEIIEGSIANVDLELERQRNSCKELHRTELKGVISGKYLIRYRSKKFALSYFYEDTSYVDKTKFQFTNAEEDSHFVSSRTYISALTHEVTIDLLRKLALHFDAYIFENFDNSVERVFRKVK